MLLLLTVGWATAEIVDRVVAVVGDEPVLLSQLALEEALVYRDVSPLPQLLRVSTDPVERAIDAALLRVLASDVALYQPPRAAVDERLAAVRGSFAVREDWEAFLARYGVDEAGLAAVLRRRMIVERLLLRNLVTPPEDVDRWVEECRALLAGARPRVRIRRVPAPEAG